MIVTGGPQALRKRTLSVTHTLRHALNKTRQVRLCSGGGDTDLASSAHHPGGDGRCHPSFGGRMRRPDSSTAWRFCFVCPGFSSLGLALLAGLSLPVCFQTPLGSLRLRTLSTFCLTTIPGETLAAFSPISQMGKLRSRKEKRPTRVEGTWENRTVVPSALYSKNGEVTAKGLLTRRTRGSFLSPDSALAEWAW